MANMSHTSQIEELAAVCHEMQKAQRDPPGTIRSLIRGTWLTPYWCQCHILIQKASLAQGLE